MTDPEVQEQRSQYVFTYKNLEVPSGYLYRIPADQGTYAWWYVPLLTTDEYIYLLTDCDRPEDIHVPFGCQPEPMTLQSWNSLHLSDLTGLKVRQGFLGSNWFIFEPMARSR